MFQSCCKQMNISVQSQIAVYNKEDATAVISPSSVFRRHRLTFVELNECKTRCFHCALRGVLKMALYQRIKLLLMFRRIYGLLLRETVGSPKR